LAEPFTEKGRQITSAQKLAKRIPFEKLELAARLDEVAFRCVNFYALQVTGPGFDLITTDDKTKIVCEEFCDKVDILRKLEEIVRDMCITGNGWLEKLFNSEGDLVDLARIDARFMDFQRDTNGFVQEDNSGKVIGYVFKDWTGKKTPLRVHQVVHFPLFSMGNELALGFVEPLYHTIYEKLNVRKGFSEEQSRHPLYVAYVGEKPDPRANYRGKMGTPEFHQKLADELEDVKARTKYVLPWWVRLERFESSKTIQPQLTEFYNQSICAGFGIPYLIAMGFGRMERATLEVSITRDLDRRIRSIQNKLSEILREQIFSELQRQYKFKEIPKIEWKEITPPDLNRMAKRIHDLVEVGVINPADVREKVYKAEGIPFKKDEEEEMKDKTGVEKLKE